MRTRLAQPDSLRTVYNMSTQQLSASLASVLARFGVTQETGTREAVELTVTDFCTARAHDGVLVKELRWGRLVICAPSRTAAYLRLDKDVLHSLLEQQAPGAVSQIDVRVLNQLSS